MSEERECESMAVFLNISMTCCLHEGHNGPHIDHLWEGNDHEFITAVVTWVSSDQHVYDSPTTGKEPLPLE
jgi:hypothetical protein